MKLATILSFSLVVSLNASVLDSYGQGARMTFKIKDATLKEAMDKIEKSSDFIFIYYDNILDVDRKINLDVKKQPIEDILDKMFESTNNTYTVVDRQIVISLKNQPEIRKDSSSVIEEDLQQRTISGTVTGAGNEALAGVTVLVKGTTIGTLTDANGKFSLSIPANAKTLLISFIGMDSKEVEIGAGIVYDVNLSQTTIGLDEVVVIGYGTQKKISVTGAISSVGTTDLVKSPTASITNTLAGRVTGLTTVQSTGRPGYDDPTIYVRGVGSLTSANSTPLMLVDGVERSFTQMDPNEIESISILKDASATAVYGIRGANGVIIVSTKRGVEGAPKISFSSSYGVQVPVNLPSFVDSYTYTSAYDNAQLSDNPSAVVTFSPFVVNAFKTNRYPDIFYSTDFVDLLWKKVSPQSQYNINISGGTKIVKYFASIGYLNQSGQVNENIIGSNDYFGYKRYNYRANIDVDATKSTKISLTIGGQNQIRGKDDRDWADTWWRVFAFSLPYAGKITPDGKQILRSGYYNMANPNNQTGIGLVGHKTQWFKNVTNTLNLDIQATQGLDFILKGLSFRFKVSNNNSIVMSKSMKGTEMTYDPMFRCDVVPSAVGDSTVVYRTSGTDGLRSYGSSSSKARNWYLESAITYNRDFGNHHVTGLLLYNASETFYPATYTDIPLGYVGIAARATYNFRSKYFADINLGYNGSENFAPGKRFGLFPAVSAGWILTEENFMKGVPFISYLKLRASYGTVGNDKMGSTRFIYRPTAYSASSSGSSGYDFGTNVIEPARFASEGTLGNPAVTWEKAVKQDYGFDLTLLRGKLSLTADYFYERRNNILTTRKTIPTLLYFSLPAVNLGIVENHGYEGDLKWQADIGKINYALGGNISFHRNKILFQDEIPQPYDYLNRTGHSVDQTWAYVTDGFWTADDVDHYKDFPDASYIPKAGDLRYKDINGDNLINTYDQVATGYPSYPEITYALTGRISYKGFDFSVLWQGAANVTRTMWDQARAGFGTTGNRAMLTYVYENSWTPDNPNSLFPRITFSGQSNNIRVSNLWMNDASYIRFKNAEIGYTFKPSFLKPIGISSLRAYINGYNLMTFSKLNKTQDPEVVYNEADYPIIQIFNIGLNITFL